MKEKIKRILSFMMLFTMLLQPLLNIKIKAQEDVEKVEIKIKESENGYLRFKGTNKKIKYFKENEEVEVFSYPNKDYYFAGIKVLDENNEEVNYRKFSNKLEFNTKKYKKITLQAKMIKISEKVEDIDIFTKEEREKANKEKKILATVNSKKTKDGFIITPKIEEIKTFFKDKMSEDDLPERFSGTGYLQLVDDPIGEYAPPATFSFSSSDLPSDFTILKHPDYPLGFHCLDKGWAAPKDNYYSFSAYRWESGNPDPENYAQYWVDVACRYDTNNINDLNAWEVNNGHIITPPPYRTQRVGAVVYIKKDKPRPPSTGSMKFRLKKIDENTGSPLSGARFKMYYEEQPENVYYYTTGYDGYTDYDTWNYLDKMICIEEVSAPSGYKRSYKTWRTTVDKGTYEMKIKNDKEYTPPTPDPTPPPKSKDKYFILHVTKKDNNTYQKLSGAEFKVTDAYGTTLKRETTGSNGEASFYLGYHLHFPLKLEEVSAPYGYKRNYSSISISESDFTFAYEDSDRNYRYEKTVYNEKEKPKEKERLTWYNFKLIKKDKDTNKPLKGAKFRIKDAYANLIKEVETDSNGTIEKIDVENKLPITVEEIKAPDGYQLDTTKHVITKDEFDYETQNQDADYIRTYYKRDKVIYNKKKNKNKYFMFYVYKKDADTKQKLNGATFELRDSNDNIIETETTANDGYIYFRGRWIKENYKFPLKLVETKAPDGYQKLKDPIIINESDFKYKNEDSNDKNYEYTKDVDNKKMPKAKIVFKKLGQYVKGYRDEKINVDGKEYTIKKPIFDYLLLPNVSFEIKNKNTNAVNRFTTTTQKENFEFDITLFYYI